MSDVTAWWGAITGTGGLALSIFNTVVANREKKPVLNIELYPYASDINISDLVNEPRGYCWKLTNHSSQVIALYSLYLHIIPFSKPQTIVAVDVLRTIPTIIESKQYCQIELHAEAINQILHRAIYKIDLHGDVPHAELGNATIRLVAIDTLQNLYSMDIVTTKETLAPSQKRINGKPDPTMRTFVTQHPERYSYSEMISNMGLNQIEVRVW